MKYSAFKQYLRISVITIIGVYILLCVLIFMVQRSLIYFPSPQEFASCQGFSDAEKVNFKGTRMYQGGTSDTIVVVYHGNGGSACDRSFLKEIITDEKHAYLFVEYAGYSNDLQSPSKKAILENVRHVEEFVQSLNKSSVIVIGESIGAAPTAYHASRGNVDRVLLISPFTRLKDVSRYHYPFLPSFVLQDRYDNIQSLNQFYGPVVILHGDVDTIVPPHFSQQLFETLPSSKKKRVLIEGAGHNDIYAFPQTHQYIREFLSNK